VTFLHRTGSFRFPPYIVGSGANMAEVLVAA
jgi:hypothetical protein